MAPSPYTPPTPGRSFIVAGLLFVLTASLLILHTPFFASSKVLTIAAGFVGSLLFLFSFVAISNLLATVSRGHESGWIEVFFSLMVASILAGSVHGVSFTTCIFFSGLQVLYLQKVSKDLYAPRDSSAAAVTKKQKGK